MVSAIHAGWRGAFSGIIEESLLNIQKLGIDPKDLVALIGPTIYQKDYIVQRDFYDMFLAQNENNEKFFLKHNGIISFDLPGYCKNYLKKHGVADIHETLISTYQHPEILSSHRYHQHNQADIGTTRRSQFSIIGIAPS